MAITFIVPGHYTVHAACMLARDNHAKLIINPATHQAIITDGPVLRGFKVILDPTRPNSMKRMLEDAYKNPD